MAKSGDIISTIADSCHSLGGITISGLALESADPKLLDVSEFDLDTHVAIQPTAIAYFGTLKRDAERRLESFKRAYDRWNRKKYAEAKVLVVADSTTKPTVDDIKAQLIVENEKEIEDWDAKLDRFKFEADTMDAWYEAWRQKSFSIKEHVTVDKDERFNSSPSIVDGDGSEERREDRKPSSQDLRKEGIRKIRQLIRGRESGK